MLGQLPLGEQREELAAAVADHDDGRGRCLAGRSRRRRRSRAGTRDRRAAPRRAGPPATRWDRCSFTRRHAERGRDEPVDAAGPAVAEHAQPARGAPSRGRDRGSAWSCRRTACRRRGSRPPRRARSAARTARRRRRRSRRALPARGRRHRAMPLSTRSVAGEAARHQVGCVVGGRERTDEGDRPLLVDRTSGECALERLGVDGEAPARVPLRVGVEVPPIGDHEPLGRGDERLGRAARGRGSELDHDVRRVLLDPRPCRRSKLAGGRATCRAGVRAERGLGDHRPAAAFCAQSCASPERSPGQPPITTAPRAPETMAASRSASSSVSSASGTRRKVELLAGRRREHDVGRWAQRFFEGAVHVHRAEAGRRAAASSASRAAWRHHAS